MSHNKEHVEKHIGEDKPLPPKTPSGSTSSEQNNKDLLKHVETQKSKTDNK